MHPLQMARAVQSLSDMTFSAQEVARPKRIWHTLGQPSDRAIAPPSAHRLRAAFLGLAVLAAVACSGSEKPSSSSRCLDDNGVSYAVGESFKCDCNECTCMAGGVVSSTAVACLPCLYGGKEMPSGSTFPDRDGCNSCTCEQATVSCTKTACACDPTKEWWRNYVATSGKECMLVDFACDNGTKPFSNDCGCGCEEPNTCPQFAQCDPGYDCAKVLADCPYVAATR